MKTLPLLCLLAFAAPVSADPLDPDAKDAAPPVAGKPAEAAPPVDQAKIDLDTMDAKKVVAKLKYDYGKTKDLTVEDIKTLALMIHAETWGGATREDAEAMAWAMAVRSYWSPTWNKKSFSALLKAYSQPINPIWQRGGSKCDDEDELEKEACSEKRLKKRESFAKLKWKDLNETARKTALDFADGKVANPVPGAVAWLAPGEWGKKDVKDIKDGGKVVGQEVKTASIGNNVFYGRKQTG